LTTMTRDEKVAQIEQLLAELKVATRNGSNLS
jgi:hypothetical protein